MCGQPFKVYEALSHMLFFIRSGLRPVKYPKLHPILETKAMEPDGLEGQLVLPLNRILDA